MSEGWKKERFEDCICFSQIGIVRSKKEQGGHLPFRYLKMDNIQNRNGLDETQYTYVDASKDEVEKYSLAQDDFLFNTRNSYELVGKAALYRPTSKQVTLFNNNVLRVRFKNFLNPAFVAYSFSTEEVKEQLKGMKSGTTSVVGIYFKSLKNLRLPVPPLPQQKQIVSILDRAFAAIDKAKANVERNLENAKELFQSKLNEVFSERGEGWEEKTLGEVCENLDKVRVPITKSKRKSGPYPYYGASGIVDYVDDYLFDDNLLLVSEDGANLLARTYPIAFSVSGKIWVNNHAHVLKFENIVTQEFMEFYLNSIMLDPFVSGMAQPKLNQRMLNSIPVPFPPIDDQSRVVNLLESLGESLNRTVQLYKQKLVCFEELKKSLLQKAFAGELTEEEVAV